MKLRLLLVFSFTLGFSLLKSQSHFEISYQSVAVTWSEAYNWYWLIDNRIDKGYIVAYQLKKNSTDSVIYFKSASRKEYLAGEARWWDSKGRLLKRINFHESYKPGAKSYHIMDNLYVPGTKQGVSEEWYADTSSGELKRKSIENYHLGLQHCLQTAFYSSGGLKYKINYDSGILNGESIYWYQNGYLESRGGFTRGNKTGWWSYFYDDGTIKMKMQFAENEKADSVFEYYRGGILKSVNYFYYKNPYTPSMEYDSLGRLSCHRHFNKSGILDSIETGYYPSGQKKYQAFNKNGNYEGKYFEWHPNGNISVKGNYKNGYAWGVWNYFNSHGKLIKTENIDVVPENIGEEVLLEIVEDNMPVIWSYATQYPEFPGGSKHYYKNDDLKIPSSVKSVEITVQCDQYGKASYTIKSSLNVKDKIRLQEYLEKKFPVIIPCKMNGKSYATTIETVLVFKK